MSHLHQPGHAEVELARLGALIIIAALAIMLALPAVLELAAAGH
jgi:hypothetical protein